MSQTREAKRDKIQGYIDLGVEALRKSGARITKPRLAVLESLAGAERSLSPKDLMERIRKNRNMPDIDLATVYRILETLVLLDLVHRVGPSGDFVACGHHGCAVELHLLMHCNTCDKTAEVDVPEDLIAPVRRYIKKSARFQPEEHIILVNGRCAACTGGAKA